MRKAPAIFLLVISLLWHTFASAHAGLVADHGDGLAHIALHLEKKPHHHHDDGSLYQDGTDESMKHVYADGCGSSVGVVLLQPPCGFGDFSAARMFSSVPVPRDSPILEGPRRPPRLTA